MAGLQRPGACLDARWYVKDEDLRTLTRSSMSDPFHTEGLASVYGLLFATAAEGLVVVDQQGVIRLHNPRMAELFGYQEADGLVGRPIEVVVPDAVAARHRGHRERYMASPAKRSMGAELDLLGRRRDGSVFPVEVSLNHFVLDGVGYAMALVSDASQRKSYELALQRSNSELEERVRQRTEELRQAEQSIRAALEKERELNVLKSRFVSMASHEFRTPLSTIMGSTDLIARYSEGQDKVLKHTTRIRAKVRELTAMLNDFLSLEKLEQGAVSIHRTRFDLVDLCIDLVEEVRVLTKPDQRIDFAHEGPREVELDQQLMSNVVTNLLSNAVKYSPDGSTIRLRTISDGSQLTLSVTDEGIGIPLEDQTHLFQRFFRASNASTVQGTGLGLSIVRRHLELLAGTIGFTSIPGQGSTFTVQVPIKP